MRSSARHARWLPRVTREAGLQEVSAIPRRATSPAPAPNIANNMNKMARLLALAVVVVVAVAAARADALQTLRVSRGLFAASAQAKPTCGCPKGTADWLVSGWLRAPPTIPVRDGWTRALRAGAGEAAEMAKALGADASRLNSVIVPQVK